MIQGFDNSDTIHRLTKAKSLSFSGYASTIKADGVIGTNCNFTSLNAAVLAGERSIFFRASFAHTGVSKNTATAGNTLTITSNVAHELLPGDDVVITASDIDGSKFVQGVFPVDAIGDVDNPLDFDITLINNTATYGTKTGGFASGKSISFHKGDKTTFEFLATTEYLGLNVVCESNALCTLTGGNCIDITEVSNNIDQVTFENLGMRPSDEGGLCVNITAASSTITNLTFKNCLFNGFKDAVWNGSLWGGAFLASSTTLTLDICKFIECTVIGITEFNTDICINFDVFAGSAGSNLRVQDCTFDTINGIGVNCKNNVVGYRVIDSTFNSIYNHAIKVASVGSFTSDGNINGNVFKNGVDTAFIQVDPKPSLMFFGFQAVQVSVEHNDFFVAGSLGLRPFYALELNGTLLRNFKVTNNTFSSIRVTGIRALEGQVMQILDNNFGFVGTSAIEFAAGFIKSTVRNNYMLGGGAITSGAPGASVDQNNNIKY